MKLTIIAAALAAAGMGIYFYKRKQAKANRRSVARSYAPNHHITNVFAKAKNHMA